MYGVAKGSLVEVVKEGESEFVPVEKVVPKMKVVDPLSKTEREVLRVSKEEEREEGPLYTYFGLSAKADLPVFVNGRGWSAMEECGSKCCKSASSSFYNVTLSGLSPSFMVEGVVAASRSETKRFRLSNGKKRKGKRDPLLFPPPLHFPLSKPVKKMFYFEGVGWRSAIHLPPPPSETAHFPQTLLETTFPSSSSV